MRNLIVIYFAFISLVVFSQRPNSIVDERSLTLSYGPSTLLFSEIGAPFSESFLYNDERSANSMVSVGYHVFHTKRFASHISIHSSAYEREDVKYFSRADVFQLNLRGEYHLLSSNYVFQPNELYLTGGVGFLYGNSTKKIKVNQGLSILAHDVVMSAVIPMGIGYRYNISDKFKLGASFDMFYVLSDMIEGNGDFGSRYANDALASLMFNVSYTFSGKKNSW